MLFGADRRHGPDHRNTHQCERGGFGYRANAIRLRSRDRARNRSGPEGNAARAVLERRQHRIGLADARPGPIAHSVREHRSEPGLLARIEKRAIVVSIEGVQWLELALEDVLS